MLTFCVFILLIGKILLSAAILICALKSCQLRPLGTGKAAENVP